MTTYSMKVTEEVLTTARDHERGHFAKAIKIAFEGTEAFEERAEAFERTLVEAIAETHKGYASSLGEVKMTGTGFWSFTVTCFSD